MDALIKAFPDMQWILTNLIAEEASIVLQAGRYRVQIIEPFNNSLRYRQKDHASDGMGVLTLKNGKVVSTQVIDRPAAFFAGTGSIAGRYKCIDKQKAQVHE